MCIFTYTRSQKHNNLSDGIIMQYATLRNIKQLNVVVAYYVVLLIT